MVHLPTEHDMLDIVIADADAIISNFNEDTFTFLIGSDPNKHFITFLRFAFLLRYRIFGMPVFHDAVGIYQTNFRTPWR